MPSSTPKKEKKEKKAKSSKKKKKKRDDAESALSPGAVGGKLDLEEAVGGGAGGGEGGAAASAAAGGGGGRGRAESGDGGSEASGSGDEDDSGGKAGGGGAGEGVKYVSPIAFPMAQRALQAKLLKLVTKGVESKTLRRGVKEVVKALRRGPGKGLVVIAGDMYPMDVISHIPVFCEEHSVPYVFVPSRDELGKAARCKRPTSVVLITHGGSRLKGAIEKVAALPTPLKA